MSTMHPAVKGRDSVVRDLRGMAERRQLDAARRRAMQEHPAGGARKLRVLVKLDTEQASAVIRVEGTLTQANLHALYSITARTNALLPGLEITIDLSGARAVDEALQELIGVARRATLPEAAVREHAACRLRVLEPQAA
ncbi:hypothetical protein LVY72_10660 [Arthrobacter sp. I2-34]|uniref:Uncharacterized protein n=1 Tax=Arthrobacter hankyongi TaxID=2904801 RepID=A0ABS9L6S9_9MICC|nr:hypothetical protein [Arthrobacter hankyongi]MCG2622376.1 hypothetical protein [Arthrobacter hankyongi]